MMHDFLTLEPPHELPVTLTMTADKLSIYVLRLTLVEMSGFI